MGLSGFERLAAKLNALPIENPEAWKNVPEEAGDSYKPSMAASYLKRKGYKEGDNVPPEVVQHAYDTREGEDLDSIINSRKDSRLVLERTSDDNFVIVHFELEQIPERSKFKYSSEYIRALERELRDGLQDSDEFTTVDVRRLIKATSKKVTPWLPQTS